MGQLREADEKYTQAKSKFEIAMQSPIPDIANGASFWFKDLDKNINILKKKTTAKDDSKDASS
ncbi:MAG: hypothetical protein HY589_01515 [Candidatus Omnitrophica bacterium]|nr:hypothetical protein [Candidatus Omnitrophota bacterium]